MFRILRKPSFFSFLLICTVTGGLSPCLSQELPASGMDSGMGGSGTIVGTVILSTGGRLQRRIQVKLTTMTRGTRTSMTDDNGVFKFDRLTAGSYTVTIDKEPEFEPFTATVDVIYMRGFPGGTYNVSARLNPKPGSEGPASTIPADFAGVPKPAIDAFTKAQEFAKTRDYAGGIDHLRYAIKEHPSFSAAYNEMGLYYLRLGKPNEADESFRKAIELNTEAFSPNLNHGILLVTSKKFAEAEPVLRKAVKIQETSPVAHLFLGQALANLGKFPEGEKELTIAIKTGGPNVREAYRTRAILLSVRGDKKAAANDLEEYLKLNPTAADADQLKAAIKQMRSESGH